ncbi:MAG: class I SAM-dependent methyltransferase [Verrucomicrobia bacterium]|nr:class I SAM-dependent methyltransferase [Verrucomicrobiota bacterium]
MSVADREKTPLRLRVSATAETLIRNGHPWLYENSIRSANRAGTTGELAVLYDRNDKFLAIGLHDANSPIRVRIVHAGKPVRIDSEWWRERLSATLAKRAGLFDELTTGFRCINGESDGWPGLVLDRYDNTLVLKIYSEVWFSRFKEILQLIQSGVDNERIVLRLSRNIQRTAEKHHLRDGQIVHGKPLSEAVIFLETGLRFEADVLRGQKTGFFLDQRENRKIVETLVAGKTVLNAFSFSGGFSLYAARGGAVSVTDLDISAHALESAKRNFVLNSANASVVRCHHETIQTDVFDWLQKNEEREFGLIILDPPSLAKRETERKDAIVAYEKLVGGGIAHLKRNGTLVAASCSAHVSADEFFQAVRTAARKSGRNFKELRTTQHALDHAATFKEAEYLKCIYLTFL